MQLFHPSPEQITTITDDGRFYGFLFFATRPYVMTAGSYVTYEIDLDDNDVINARSLFYHEEAGKLDGLVAEFCRRFGVDEDTAEDIIAEREQLDSDDGADQFEVQAFTARAARLLGFRAVLVSDEQGSAYMVDMLGREADLTVRA